MKLTIVTDAFPPRCGGSGWSTYELVKWLRAHGHELTLIQPRPGEPPGERTRTYDGFAIIEVGARAPRVPYVRNYFKNERLTADLSRWLVNRFRTDRPDVVHAQHVLTTPPAIAAARSAGIPVVCTVRDYWPVCYWSDLIYDFDAEDLCPACTPGMMTRCVRPRAGAAWPLALPFIPYMRANLARKQDALRHADGVIAVSTTIGRDLIARSAGLDATRLHVIPNPVDIGAIRATIVGPAPLAEPYAIYAGKLATNKGVRHLVPAIDRAGLPLPLVVVGDGPARDEVERDAQRSGRDVRIVGWQPREIALAWLAHAQFLIFPSFGPESLSRVLLESSALGVPAAAINTGGTPDIVEHELTGLLSADVEGLARDVRRLAMDADLRARLGAAARAHVERHFDAPGVVSRIERVYERVTGAGNAS